jgi:hypothetical protein
VRGLGWSAAAEYIWLKGGCFRVGSETIDEKVRSPRFGVTIYLQALASITPHHLQPQQPVLLVEKDRYMQAHTAGFVYSGFPFLDCGDPGEELRWSGRRSSGFDSQFLVLMTDIYIHAEYF